MGSSNPIGQKLRDLLDTLKRYAWLWILPAVTGAIATAGYGLFQPASWEARQALLLRDEATGDVRRQGRFDNLDAMKTAQKTVLEIVRNHALLAAALKSIGPPAGQLGHSDWPTRQEVEECKKQITLKPPKGAEFGSTEVIYLSVEAESPPRAIQLADAVYRQLEMRMQQLRNDKAAALLSELQKTVDLARADLDQATEQLQSIESQVGSDLPELRILNDSASGESILLTTMKTVEDELRQYRNRQRTDQQLQSLLKAAQQNAGHLIAMPNGLLESQPALRRLKEGLVDAQLRTARLLGSMSKQHPEVRSAIDAEQEIRGHIHRELELGVRALDADLAVNGQRIAALDTQIANIQQRLAHLAGLRARYGNLVTEVQRRSQILAEAQKQLADARAAHAAAQTTSLISQIESPQTGDRPVGPGLAALTVAGFGGGLTVGLGLVFLAAPVGGRWGRRSGDHAAGRRSTDAPAEVHRTTERPAAPAARPSPCEDTIREHTDALAELLAASRARRAAEQPSRSATYSPAPITRC